VKESILQTLRELRAYAISQGAEVRISYHAEDSHLMRFANSAISLNTNEQLSRLEFTAYEGRKRARYEMITGLDDLSRLKQGVDHVIEMVHHAQPLTYDPTIPCIKRILQMKPAMMPVWLNSTMRHAWLFSTRWLRGSRRTRSNSRASFPAVPIPWR